MMRARISAIALLSLLMVVSVCSSAMAGSYRPVTVDLPQTMKLVALSPDGKAASITGKGKLTLKPKSSTFTLQLINADGKYVGPIVASGRGSTVVLGMKAGTNIGKIRLKNGFATPVKKLKKRSLVKRITAKAEAGVPIGAGKFGLVRSKVVNGLSGGHDLDRDGIPNVFDIDDNGNLTIDNMEASGVTATGKVSSKALAAPPSVSANTTSFTIFSNLKLAMPNAINTNANGISTAEVDASMSASQTLAISVLNGNKVALDCAGLSYCSSGGTGKSPANGSFANPPAFPDATNSDTDGNGYIAAGPTGDFQLLTGAVSSEIGSGDTMSEIVDGGTEIPGTLNFVFSSVPGVVSIDAGSGTETFSYPVSEGAKATVSNPLLITGGKATFTVWRPQREAITSAGEGTGYMDIGQLGYQLDIPNGPAASGASNSQKGPGACPIASYTTSDPNLTVGADRLTDQAVDAPADPKNVLTFTVDIESCLSSAGINWNSGEVLPVDIQARTVNGDNAAQKLYLLK